MAPKTAERRCVVAMSSYHWLSRCCIMHSGDTQVDIEVRIDLELYRRRHWRISAAKTTWSVLSRCFSSSRSVMRILYTSCNRPYTLKSTGFKSGEFEGHSWGEINSGVSFFNNSTVTRAWWACQVSQGSVETLFGWGGKRSQVLQ